MKAKIFILLLIIPLLGCPLGQKEAATLPNTPENITIETGYFVINFSWSGDDSDYFTLYLKEDSGWSIVKDFIPEKSLRLFDFPFDTNLRYGISATLNGVESEITPGETIIINKSDYNIQGFKAYNMISLDSVELDFNSIPGNFKYHIYRDDTLIDSTLSCNYIDFSGKADTLYTYSVTWENLITGDIGPLSKGIKGIYSTFIDPWEKEEDRELTDFFDGTLYKFDTLLDRDRYYFNVIEGCDVFLSVDIPEDYGIGYLYLENDLIGSYSLPLKDLKLKGSNKTYNLEIAALDEVENFNKDYSIKLSTTALDPPSDFKTEIINNIVSLSWDSKFKCNLYRRETESKWELLDSEITENNYKDSTIVTGKDYFYGIVATQGEKESKLIKSSKVNIPNQLVYVTGLKSKPLFLNSGIFLSWNRLNSHYSYDIYRSTTGNELGEIVGSTEDLTFIDYSSPELLKDKVYYYRIIWKDPLRCLSGGVPEIGIPGFYSDLTDTREPYDNSRENQVVESFTLGIDFTTTLYKMSELIDRDWFIHIVPAYTSRYLSGSSLEGRASINIYNEDELPMTITFPFKDIELKNSTSKEKKIYFEVIPNTGVRDFIESYKLNISDF